MQLVTRRLVLKVPSAADAQVLYNYYQKNRNYLKKWFVDQPQEVYELPYITQNLDKCLQKHKETKEVKFFIYQKADTGKLAGELNFSNIIMGGFLSCYTGYHLDEHLQGKGIMTEALNAGVNYMFNKRDCTGLKPTSCLTILLRNEWQPSQVFIRKEYLPAT